MKKHLLLFTLLVFSISLFAKDLKKGGTITYTSYNQGTLVEGSKTTLEYSKNQAQITESNEMQKIVPGYPSSTVYIDFANKQVISHSTLKDAKKIYSASDLKYAQFEFLNETEKILGYECKKAKISINSNTIEVWYTDQLSIKGSCMAGLMVENAVILKYLRNGSSEQRATQIDFFKQDKNIIPADLGTKLEGKEYRTAVSQSFLININVFDNEKICWDKMPENPSLESGQTLHFGGGTLILKKVKLPKDAYKYSIFAELIQRSNGDAYDRTGSVFVIPTDKQKSFLDALQKGMDAVPMFTAKDGTKFAGAISDENYSPVVELMRFFTSFGVSHFNDRLAIPGIEWRDSSVFKENVSYLTPLLTEEAIIGVYIGNYDKGGHKISLNLRYYPNGETEKPKTWIYPLFCTTNILEMGGQGYASIFGTDSLTVTLNVPEDVKNPVLYYLSTGHGGWGGGDEFNPKENSFLLNGNKFFAYTPWRDDCATYREYNPVSGNFWNGLSSSDFSRSGWCPGTITNPVRIPLSDLKAGKNVIQVAIPQGKPEGSSISYWNISGVIVGER